MFPQPNVLDKPQNTNPRKLLIVTHPKVGKTHAAMQLEDSLLIDLENSTGFYGGPAAVFNMQSNYAEYAESADKPIPYDIYAAAYFKSLIKQAKEQGKPLCKYLIIDTATALQDIAEAAATVKYKKTTMGKSFKENSVLELAHGAGYLKLREMFKNLYQTLQPVYSEALIILAHPKDSSVIVDGKELSATELNLVGKLKHIVTTDMDAMGIMYRDPARENVNVISFKNSKQDLISGSRCPHLKNTTIDFSIMNEDGTLTVNWDKIFLNK